MGLEGGVEFNRICRSILKKYDDLSYLLEDIILALSRIFESSKGAVIVENSD